MRIFGKSLHIGRQVMSLAHRNRTIWMGDFPGTKWHVIVYVHFSDGFDAIPFHALKDGGICKNMRVCAVIKILIWHLHVYPMHDEVLACWDAVNRVGSSHWWWNLFHWTPNTESGFESTRWIEMIGVWQKQLLLKLLQSFNHLRTTFRLSVNTVARRTSHRMCSKCVWVCFSLPNKC